MKRLRINIGLRVLLGYFLIVALAALLVGKVFVEQVKPGVRQAMESTLVDTANVLAAMAADDLKAGRIAEGRFAGDLARVRDHDPEATIWRFPKRSIDYRVTVTDARGIVVFDSEGRDLGRDNSRWNDVYRTLRGEYGARSSPETPGDTAHTVMHVAAPIYDPGDRRTLLGVLTLSQPNRSIGPFIGASQRSIRLRGAWLIGISALIGVLMTWWLARRIGRLNRYAQAVAAGEPVAPPPPRRDEIGDLARALEQRGHAAQDKLRLDDERIDEDGLRPVVSALGAARGHPDWERGEGRRGAGGSDRQALEAEIARELDRRFDSPVA